MSQSLAEDVMTQLAASYALGALDADEREAFERHLQEGCDACAAELREFEESAAQLALTVPEAEPPHAVREKLLSLVASESRDARASSMKGMPTQFVGAADFLVVRRDEGKWMKSADPGVFIKVLFVDKERDTVTTLVRLEPGAAITRHRHLGVEQCLVLEGEVRSGDLSLRAGDYNCAMPDTVHNEISTEGGALLLLVSPESFEPLGHASDARPHA